MDPVSQVLAQQDSGSAQGQGFGQFFSEGVRQRQNQESLNLSKRRMSLLERQDRRDAQLLPLKKDMLSMQIAQAGMALALDRNKLAAQTELTAALPEISALEVDFMRSPDGYATPELIERARVLSQRYPRAFAEGMPGGDLLLSIKSVPMRNQQFKEILGRLGQLPTGSSFNIPGFGAMSRDLPSTGAMPGTFSTFGKQIADYHALLAAGDQEGATLMKSKLLSDAEGQGFAIEFDSNGRVTSIRQGAGASSVPASVQAKAQEKLASADVALFEVLKLRDTIIAQPEAFGLRGIGTSIVESLKGQVDRNAPAPVSAARHQAAITFQRLADGLRVDSGNMSRYELDQLKDIGDTRGWEDTPQKAFDKANNIINAVVAQKLRALRTVGQPADDNLLRLIPSSEVDGLISNSLLSPADAHRWFKLFKGGQ